MHTDGIPWIVRPVAEGMISEHRLQRAQPLPRQLNIFARRSNQSRETAVRTGGLGRIEIDLRSATENMQTRRQRLDIDASIVIVGDPSQILISKDDGERVIPMPVRIDALARHLCRMQVQ